MFVDLYGSDTPIIYIKLNDTDFYIPFKHGFKFYTKGTETHWGLEGLDEEEFTKEMREIKDWNWILVLDGDYQHATMLSSLQETIHGNRFTISTRKHYKNNHTFRSQNFEISVKLHNNQDELYNQAFEMVRQIRNFYPGRIKLSENINIIPFHSVSEYILNCIEYVHS